MRPPAPEHRTAALPAWVGRASPAVTAGLGVGLLAEHTRAFPTWSEAITPPALDLAARTDGAVS